MGSSKPKILRRALGELLIIIVGVIIALQFEDLRDQRELRSQEEAALGALKGDLLEMLDRLEGNIRRQDAYLEAQRTLLEISEGRLPAPPADSLALLNARAFLNQRFEPVTGSFDALVSAGDLRLIRSDSLRADLASLYGYIGGGFEDEDINTLVRNEYFMAIGRTMSLRSATGDYFNGWIELTGSPPAADLDLLLEDDGFLTALTAMALTEGGQLNYFRTIERRISDLLNLIDLELGGT